MPEECGCGGGIKVSDHITMVNNGVCADDSKTGICYHRTQPIPCEATLGVQALSHSKESEPAQKNICLRRCAIGGGHAENDLGPTIAWKWNSLTLHSNIIMATLAVVVHCRCHCSTLPYLSHIQRLVNCDRTRVDVALLKEES